jgi:hypothetical protein
VKVSSWRRFTVSELTLKGWAGRYGRTPRCQLCDHTLVIGDDVLVKSTRRAVKPNARYFHYRCYSEGSVSRGEVGETG